MKEKEIKLKMIEFLRKRKNDDIVAHEITFGGNLYSNKNAVRADLFVVGEGISAYEIKSEHDNLTRLDKQIKTYRKFANSVSVVVAKKFVSKLKLHDDVGIYIIDNGKIRTRKKPTFKDISVDRYLEYLWQVEFKGILKGVPYGSGLSKRASIERLREILSEDELRRVAIFRLKERLQEESDKLCELAQKMDIKSSLPKKSFDINLKVTSLADMPFGMIKGYKKVRNRDVK